MRLRLANSKFIFTCCALFMWLTAGAQIPGTVSISAPVAPFNAVDTYPSHLPTYGKGGMRTVTNYSDLASIPNPRKERGMLAYVMTLTNIYRLAPDLTNWVKANNVFTNVAELRASPNAWSDQDIVEV